MGLESAVIRDASGRAVKLAGIVLCGLVGVLSLAFLPAYAGYLKWTNDGGPYGGTVKTILIDPNDTKVIYVGTANGVFKTVDGGANWMQSGIDYTQVFDLVFDPRDSKIIYAASWAGFYMSPDGGATWVTSPSELANSAMYSIVVSPDNPDILYAGTDQKGVIKSMDGGNSWSQTGPENTTILSLAIDTSNPEVIYAGRRYYIDGKEAGGVYKSTDGGTTWEFTGPANEIIHQVMVDPS